MPDRIADSAADIARELRRIRKEEGRGDDNYQTASDNDLTAIGLQYGVERTLGESDYPLRQRIAEVIRQRIGS